MSSEAPFSHAWFGNVRRLTRRKCSKTASHLHTRVSADLPRKIQPLPSPEMPTKRQNETGGDCPRPTTYVSASILDSCFGRSVAFKLCKAQPLRFRLLRALWCGHATVVGRIKIVAIGASDGCGGPVIPWRVVSTGRGSANGGSTDGSSTDAYRHSRAHTAIDAAAVNAPTVHATSIGTSAIICRGIGCSSQN